jgi:hypothetical protein
VVREPAPRDGAVSGERARTEAPRRTAAS